MIPWRYWFYQARRNVFDDAMANNFKHQSQLVDTKYIIRLD
jgi:hypothetical protein